MPAASNHSAMSRLSAAAPEMKKRTRPPKRSRTLVKTSLSKRPCLTLSADRDRLALALEALDLEAGGEGSLEELLLGAALGRLHGDDAAVGLLEDAGGRAHEGRLHDAQVVDDLLDATVDRGSEAARHLGRHQHLAERVRHRQPAELEVALGEDALRADGLALVDPRRVPQAYALGTAGGAGGVDQGRELLGRDGLGRRADDVGLLGELGGAQRGEVVERDDPVAVGLALEGDDLDRRAAARRGGR